MGIKWLLAAVLAFLAAPMAVAQSALDGLESIGKPVDRGTGFQPSATELARDIVWLDTMILIIITAIVVFVTALLIIVMVKYNAKANDDPATFT
ncbi:MAG: cytochrome c oxidase subunit II transmembrane domain-containing protein, partial [Pseudomonadota bacterium]